MKYQDSETGKTKTFTVRRYVIQALPVSKDMMLRIGRVQTFQWKQITIAESFTGGCGDYEATGFLACENERGNFVWAIFFEDTEPIQKIEIQDDSIIARGAAERDTQLKITINSHKLTEIPAE